MATTTSLRRRTTGRRGGSTLRVDWRLYAERQSPASAHTDFSLLGLIDDDVRFRDDFIADEADLFGGHLSLRLARGLDPTGFRWSTELTVDGATGSFRYVRPSLGARVDFPFVGPLVASVEGATGTSYGTLPAQAHWFVGGTATVRGYDPLTLRGTRFARGRAEIATAPRRAPRPLHRRRLGGRRRVLRAGRGDPLRRVRRQLPRRADPYRPGAGAPRTRRLEAAPVPRRRSLTRMRASRGARALHASAAMTPHQPVAQNLIFSGVIVAALLACGPDGQPQFVGATEEHTLKEETADEPSPPPEAQQRRPRSIRPDLRLVPTANRSWSRAGRSAAGRPEPTGVRVHRARSLRRRDLLRSRRLEPTQRRLRPVSPGTGSLSSTSGPGPGREPERGRSPGLMGQRAVTGWITHAVVRTAIARSQEWPVPGR